VVSLGARFESTWVREIVPGPKFDSEVDDAGAMVLWARRATEDLAGKESFPSLHTVKYTRDSFPVTRKIWCRQKPGYPMCISRRALRVNQW
jgi:hypothetical protein